MHWLQSSRVADWGWESSLSPKMKLLKHLNGERQSGKLLKKPCTDNGTEWINKIICQFCNWNGVIHQMAVPYGQEQNGLAERMITVYFEMVRCMLHSLGLDLWYWGEAFMYSIYIWNLLPTHSLEDKVLYHGCTNHKPDVSHICLFRSITYANIPKKVQGENWR
jgi:hypothetical protein